MKVSLFVIEGISICVTIMLIVLSVSLGNLINSAKECIQVAISTQKASDKDVDTSICDDKFKHIQKFITGCIIVAILSGICACTTGYFIYKDYYHADTITSMETAATDALQ
jgi:hypothetical protein